MSYLSPILPLLTESNDINENARYAQKNYPPSYYHNVVKNKYETPLSNASAYIHNNYKMNYYLEKEKLKKKRQCCNQYDSTSNTCLCRN